MGRANGPRTSRVALAQCDEYVQPRDCCGQVEWEATESGLAYAVPVPCATAQADSGSGTRSRVELRHSGPLLRYRDGKRLRVYCVHRADAGEWTRSRERARSPL